MHKATTLTMLLLTACGGRSAVLDTTTPDAAANRTSEPDASATSGASNAADGSDAAAATCPRNQNAPWDGVPCATEGQMCSGGAMLACPPVCTCKAGVWRCVQVSCDAGAGHGDSGAAGCPVLASSYDRSCTVDADCINVGQVLSCPATACALCKTGTVNTAASAKYAVDFSRATAGVQDDGCNCDSEAPPCCNAGLCQQCSWKPPTRP